MTRLLLALLLFAQPVTALAQDDSTTVFGRALIRRIGSMEKDSAFLAVTNGVGVDEYDWGEMDFATLDDHALIGFFRMFATSIGRMRREECLRAYSGKAGLEMLITMGNTASDSLEADTWAGAFEAILWGFLVPSPQGPAAPSRTVVALMGKMRDGMSNRLRLLAANNEGRVCTMVPMMLLKLMDQEPAAAGPMLRRFAIMSNQ